MHARWESQASNEAWSVSIAADTYYTNDFASMAELTGDMNEFSDLYVAAVVSEQVLRSEN